MVSDYPYVIISTALSIDGCIDDTSNERLILSNEADFREVDELRAECDAILVGANTLRNDNPSLRIHSTDLIERRKKKDRDLVRVSITKSGNLSSDLKFFRDDNYILYCPEELSKALSSTLKGVRSYQDGSAATILRDLKKQGIEKLMIEGGAKINTFFLESGLVNELRLAIAPFIVGDPKAPHLFFNGPNTQLNPFTLIEVKQLSDMVVMRYKVNMK